MFCKKKIKSGLILECSDLPARTGGRYFISEGDVSKKREINIQVKQALDWSNILKVFLKNQVRFRGILLLLKCILLFSGAYLKIILKLKSLLAYYYSLHCPSFGMSCEKNIICSCYLVITSSSK